MLTPSKMSKTATLTECAILVAVSFVLSLIPSFSMPLGGTISWFATVPILLAAIRHGTAWGAGTALVYSLTQLLLGMSNVSYAAATSLAAAVGCALLDYILAFSLIGVAGGLYKSAKTKTGGILSALLLTGLFRLICSFLSGILIWGPYAPDGWSIPLYSLAYNAAWCVPDVLLALIAVFALSKIRGLPLLPAKTNV